jgi:hypothetical protein
MDLLVSDGGEPSDPYAEPIEPGSAFHKMEANQGGERQRDSHQPQIATGFHRGVGGWALVQEQRRLTDDQRR